MSIEHLPSGTTVITGAHIEVYRKLSTRSGLALEIHLAESGFPATSGPTKGLAFTSAKRILREAKVQPARTRQEVLAQLEEVLREQGLIPKSDVGGAREVEGVLDRQEEGQGPTA